MPRSPTVKMTVDLPTELRDFLETRAAQLGRHLALMDAGSDVQVTPEDLIVLLVEYWRDQVDPDAPRHRLEV